MAQYLSVLLPVFNVERFLPRALESILDQTFRDFELIAVDDGSSDQTLAILRRYAARDGRMRIVSRPNTGIVGALNDALALARGELLARMDGDDVSVFDRFQKQIDFLHARPDHVAVGCDVLLMDEDGSPICIKKDTRYTHEQIDDAHLNNGWPLTHGAVVMRRDAVLRAGGYRERFKWLEDLDLFLRIAEIGQLGNVPEVLYHYRQNPASVCWTRQGEQAVIREALYHETRRRRGLSTESIDAEEARSAYISSDLHRLWAWWALGERNVSTARKHALRTVRRSPLRVDSWRVLACALRGH